MNWKKSWKSIKKKIKICNKKLKEKKIDLYLKKKIVHWFRKGEKKL